MQELLIGRADSAAAGSGRPCRRPVDRLSVRCGRRGRDPRGSPRAPRRGAQPYSSVSAILSILSFSLLRIRQKRKIREGHLDF